MPNNLSVKLSLRPPFFIKIIYFSALINISVLINIIILIDIMPASAQTPYSQAFIIRDINTILKSGRNSLESKSSIISDLSTVDKIGLSQDSPDQYSLKIKGFYYKLDIPFTVDFSSLTLQKEPIQLTALEQYKSIENNSIIPLDADNKNGDNKNFLISTRRRGIYVKKTKIDSGDLPENSEFDYLLKALKQISCPNITGITRLDNLFLVSYLGGGLALIDKTGLYWARAPKYLVSNLVTHAVIRPFKKLFLLIIHIRDAGFFSAFYEPGKGFTPFKPFFNPPCWSFSHVTDFKIIENKLYLEFEKQRTVSLNIADTGRAYYPFVLSSLNLKNTMGTANDYQPKQKKIPGLLFSQTPEAKQFFLKKSLLDFAVIKGKNRFYIAYIKDKKPGIMIVSSSLPGPVAENFAIKPKSGFFGYSPDSVNWWGVEAGQGRFFFVFQVYRESARILEFDPEKSWTSWIEKS